MTIAGIAIFGPGSEWFWAMSQFLVLTVTGLAIYRQLRAQGSANALQAQAALVARWNAPEMVRLRVATLLAIASGTPTQPVTLRLVGNFFAEMAALRTHRHLRSTDSWEIWSGQTQFWWALVLPWISEIRAKNSGIYGSSRNWRRRWLGSIWRIASRTSTAPNSTRASNGRPGR